MWKYSVKLFFLKAFLSFFAISFTVLRGNLSFSHFYWWCQLLWCKPQCCCVNVSCLTLCKRHRRQTGSSCHRDSMGERREGRQERRESPGLSNGLLTPRWHPQPPALVWLTLPSQLDSLLSAVKPISFPARASEGQLNFCQSDNCPVEFFALLPIL